MKTLTILLLALALVAAPLAAGRGGGGGVPSLNGNCHMCPVARGATLTGYEAFLRRAKANKIPRKLVNNVRQTVAVLRRFGV